jgi:HSP20 family protein
MLNAIALKSLTVKYYRSFNLPELIQADKINAEFKDGQLTITVPKAEEAKPKEIEIKVK